MPLRISGGFSSNGSEADQPDHDRPSAELQPSTPNGLVDRPAARAAPLYYFALVQKEEAASSAAEALAERPPADPRSLSCGEVPLYDDLTSMAFRSFDGVSMSMGMGPSASGRPQLSWPGPEHGGEHSMGSAPPVGPSAAVRRFLHCMALVWCARVGITACAAWIALAAPPRLTSHNCVAGCSLAPWRSRCRPFTACAPTL